MYESLHKSTLYLCCCQGDLVRKLKEEGRPKAEVSAAVSELKVRKKALETKEKSLAPKQHVFDKAGVEDLMKRRFFVAPSFSIYGGEYSSTPPQRPHISPTPPHTPTLQVLQDCMTMVH